MTLRCGAGTLLSARHDVAVSYVFIITRRRIEIRASRVAATGASFSCTTANRAQQAATLTPKRGRLGMDESLSATIREVPGVGIYSGRYGAAVSQNQSSYDNRQRITTFSPAAHIISSRPGEADRRRFISADWLRAEPPLDYLHQANQQSFKAYIIISGRRFRKRHRRQPCAELTGRHQQL